MENIDIEDKDFDILKELGCFKNRPFSLPEEVLGIKKYSIIRTSQKNSHQLVQNENEIEKYEKMKKEPYYKTFSFIEKILEMGFQPENEKQPFTPAFFISMLPKDITESHARILFTNLDKIESFYIKARIADVLWESKKLSKDNTKVAEIAIKAYLDSINYILKEWKNFIKPFYLASQELERVITIMLPLEKYRDYFDILIKFFDRTEIFHEDKECFFLLSLGKSTYKLVKKKKISQAWINSALDNYLKLFKGIENKFNFVSLDNELDTLFSIGVKLSRKANQKDYVDYFNEQNANAYLEAAENSKEAAVKARYLKKAILIYGSMGSKDNEIYKLKKELSEVEKLILDEMKYFAANIEGYEEFEKLFKKELSGLEFKEFLSKFVNFCFDCFINNYDYIKSTKIERSPLLRMYIDRISLVNKSGKTVYNNKKESHIDKDGKTVYNNKKESHIDKDGKTVYNNKEDSSDGNILFNLYVFFQIMSRLVIKNGLEIINREHKFSYDNILAFIKSSSFIPKYHTDFFSNGLSYFLHNEMLEAAALLIPQIEESLRYCLSQKDVFVDTLESDEVEKPIINLYKLFKLCYENNILDEKLGFYLERLLTHRSYPLRHYIAHGKIDDTIANDDTCYIACAIILFLVLESTGILKFKCIENKKLNNMFADMVKTSNESSQDMLAKKAYEKLDDISYKVEIKF